MKVLKFGISMFALYGQSFAYSQVYAFLTPQEVHEMISTDVKYLLCVNAKESTNFFWAQNTDGSYAFVRGNVHNKVTGVNKFGTPIVTDLFKVNIKYLKENLYKCPKNFFMQPADSYSKKLYQLIFINGNNDYYIYPGQAEVTTIEKKRSDFDSLSGLAIG